MTHTATVRLMTWNVLEGFHQHRPGQPPLWDAERKAAAQELVRALRPDVMILNEALWCRPADGYVVDYAGLFGFPTCVADVYDGVWGNAILGPAALVHQRRFRIHNRGGLRATFDFPSGRLEVATYHPHPDRRPEAKARDFAALLMAEPAPHPFVIAGDFNAICPEDHPDLDALEVAFSRFCANPRTSADRFIQSGRSLFPTLVSLGLHDALPEHARRHSMPTDLISPDHGSAMRIDHAWVNDAVTVRNAFVVVNPLSERASDHYPLVVDLELHPPEPGAGG